MALPRQPCPQAAGSRFDVEESRRVAGVERPWPQFPSNRMARPAARRGAPDRFRSTRTVRGSCPRRSPVAWTGGPGRRDRASRAGGPPSRRSPAASPQVQSALRDPPPGARIGARDRRRTSRAKEPPAFSEALAAFGVEHPGGIAAFWRLISASRRSRLGGCLARRYSPVRRLPPQRRRLKRRP